MRVAPEQALLDAMMDSGTGAPPNVWNFNICIDAHSKSGEWEKAVEKLRTVMPAAGVKPDVTSYASCIDAAGKAEQWDVALALWDEISPTSPSSPTTTGATTAQAKTKAAVAPNDYTYGIVIDICGKAGLVGKALALLAESRAAAGVSPTLYMFNSAIATCSRAGLWEHALCLLRDIGEAGLAPDVVSYSSAIAAFRGREVGQLELDIALGLLEEMRRGGIKPTNFSHSSAIALCATAGRHDRALELFEELKVAVASGSASGSGSEEQMPPLNEVVFTATIDSCGDSGDWETAMRLLAEMEEVSGVAPGLTAFNGAIRACCGGGRWHLGHSLLERMRRDGVDPDVSSMNALVRGLRPRK